MKLKVSQSRRALTYNDTEPFVWLGDTAWELLHRCSREEIIWYLDRRAEQGFTVIQTVMIPEFHGLEIPDYYGLLPLIDKDPRHPNPSFLDRVADLLQLAAERDLVIGLLPTWGGFVHREEAPFFPNPVVFDIRNAFVYGQSVAKRLAGYNNLVWILGGDRTPEGEIDVWRAMAQGLNGRGNGVLSTYHPCGGQSSSEWLHEEDWLDFNVFQSGHSDASRPDRQAIADYMKEPVKPVLNGEPSYEAIPNDFGKREGKLGPAEVRRSLYGSLLNGAFGFTYGCNEVWMMWRTEMEPIHPLVKPPFLGSELPWWEAINRPGAGQIRHARKVIETLGLDFVPQPEAILGNTDEPATRQSFARGERGWVAYTPGPQLHLNSLLIPTEGAKWMNPVDGQECGFRTETPPWEGDALLFGML